MSVETLNKIWPEWEIDEKPLGKGSYGVVYKAVRRDHNVESYAAIKVISIPGEQSELDDLRSEGLDLDASRTYLEALVNDFVGEIQMMESLKGVQNIVSVEDYKVVEREGEIGWDVYIRMELLTPFNSYICDKKLSEEEVIKLGCDICTALEICGKRNIIHRDIKPENIFVNDFGHYKLGDFGIARKMENMTGGLSQKGTFNYMAPEVANSNDYDARVDTYSLGIVLYRLLNGNRLPFLDTEKQLLNPNERRIAVERRIKGENLPAPCEASGEMAAVILRACAYDPDKRFASATEMKEALMSVVNKACVAPSDDTDKTTSVRRAAEECNATESVRKADESVERTESVRRVSEKADQTESVRSAPAEQNQNPVPIVNSFDSTPKKAVKKPAVVEKTDISPIPVVQDSGVMTVKPEKKPGFSRGMGLGIHRLTVFLAPLVLLLVYIGFYAWLIPSLYGEAVTFVDWIRADVDHITEAIHNVKGIFTSVYMIVLLVILQYLILGSFIASLFFFAKELSNPKKYYNKKARYKGKAPQMMLEDIYRSLKTAPVKIDGNALDYLKTVFESMNFSKDFGLIKDRAVVDLENDICLIIDSLKAETEAYSEGSETRISDLIMTLKQKSVQREKILKK